MVGSRNPEMNKGYPPPTFLVFSYMYDFNDDLGAVICLGKLKTQTFKEFQLERLIKSGAVIPASKLAEAKELELQRARDFEAAVTDEERLRRAFRDGKDTKTRAAKLTRVPFTD